MATEAAWRADAASGSREASGRLGTLWRWVIAAFERRFVVGKVDGHYTVCFEASTRPELESELKILSGPVPALGNGLTKRHVEDRAIGRCLGKLAGGEPFTLPLALHRGERPDFMVECDRGKVGIEVTQAVPGELAQIRAVEWRENIERTRGPRLFQPGVRLSAAEAKTAARRDDPELLMPGEERILTNWVEAMRWTIEKKSAKFEGYSRYDRNMLLIDDQWPSHDLAEIPALDLLRRTLDWRSVGFDSVLIDRGRTGTVMCLSEWRRPTRRCAQRGRPVRRRPASRRPDCRRTLGALADAEPGNGRTVAKLIRLAASVHQARRVFDRFESAKAKCHPYAPACALARLLIGHDRMIEGHELLVTAQDEADAREEGRQYDAALHEFFLVEEEGDG